MVQEGVQRSLNLPLYIYLIDYIFINTGHKKRALFFLQCSKIQKGLFLYSFTKAGISDTVLANYNKYLLKYKGRAEKKGSANVLGQS